MLTREINEKRYTDAAQTVHKAKSSLGSIGANLLYELAIELQKALDEKKEDDITFLFNDFSRKFKKLLGEITDF